VSQRVQFTSLAAHPVSSNGDEEVVCGSLRPRQSSRRRRPMLSVKLRQHVRTLVSAAFITLSVQRASLGGPQAAYAVTYQGSTATMVDDQQAVVTEAEKPRIESMPDKEHPSLNARDFKEVAKDDDKSKLTKPHAGPQLNLKDFEKLRKSDLTLQEEETDAASASLISSPGEARRIKKFEKANEKATARRNAKEDSIRLKRQSKRKAQVSDVTQNSKIAQIASPVAGGAFFGIMFIRNKIRMDRERAFVQDNIEKMEQQKAEYFNVTGQALSDDDLMESLRSASGNMTVSDEDLDEDDEEDDEPDESPPPTDSGPSPPSDFDSGPSAGGPSPNPPAPEDGMGDGAPSISDSSKASDDDIERMKNLFQK
jgi:hypothetical protein